MKKMTPTEAWILLIGIGLLFGTSLEGLWRGICKLKDLGKSWVLVVDGDTQSASLKRIRVGPEWVIDGREGRAYSPGQRGVLDTYSPARLGYAAKWGKLYCFDQTTGHALRAPTSGAIQQGLEARGHWLPVDSGAILRKLRRNVKQDWVDQQAHIKRQPLAAFIMMGLLACGFVGILAFMLGRGV